MVLAQNAFSNHRLQCSGIHFLATTIMRTYTNMLVYNVYYESSEQQS